MSTLLRLAVVPPVLAASALTCWSVWNGADLSGAGTSGVLVIFGGGWLLRRRDRDRPLRWRPAIRLPGGGTAAGLVAPLSRAEAAWWLLTTAFGAVLLGGVAGWLARPGRWPGLTLGALAAAAALWVLYRLCQNLPDLRRIAIVEAGVLWRGRLIRWAEIGSVRITRPTGDEDGSDVELRLAGDRKRLLGLTPPGSMIDPPELRLAVLTYLRAPERRAELNSPVDPRGEIALPPDPRLGRHPHREAVEGGTEA
ncbi:hypothetical protein ACIA8K_13480 [Catenuloplanes sp. NPDC051500]|uniref:hypothetical protein n=1 Tax=Catenuloplanes sp. NPDC051500 TaxID=3363959 RepID=UPI0037B8EAF4